MSLETTSETKPSAPPRGVVYLGHIPHGFYEKEMKEFFTQFGEVKRLRLARSRRTGRSRGYAFIEFCNHEIAPIVASSMNGYLLFNHILKCSVVPPEDVHNNMFKGQGPRFTGHLRIQKEVEKQNRPLNATDIEKKRKRLEERDLLRRKRIKEAGISFKFTGFDEKKSK
ncbi:hypothetical protein RCL1_002718 [Eukaryota sp. TZLM3-RCL]